MPIYEYKCLKCGEHFELRRSMSDNDEEVECPECGASDTHRLFSTFATSSTSSICAPSTST